jgi:hypothetical protein
MADVRSGEVRAGATDAGATDAGATAAGAHPATPSDAASHAGAARLQRRRGEDRSAGSTTQGYGRKATQARP